MKRPLAAAAFDQLFRDARSYTTWSDTPVTDDLLTAVWNDARMGPTSANCSPARIVFVRSTEAKERLRPCLSAGNVEKTMAAPVTAIIGQDMAFYEKLPTLFPHTDARSWFAGKDAKIRETAFRNSSLQGAYLMLAARAHGLDCGPMSGFNTGKVDQAFFDGTSVTANFLCNLGFGTDVGLHPRGPRLGFAEACSVV